MAFPFLASYPNSRIKSRLPTRVQDPYKMWAPSTGDAPGTIMPTLGAKAGGEVTANGNVKVADADGNRTFVYLRNLSLTEKLYFAYADEADIVNDGNELEPTEGYDIDQTSQPVYVRAEALVRIMVQFDYGKG